MSDTVLNHGYIPEEHAPDPVISHGDPTPPGKIGIWLFLASEIMFFVAILGSYVILRSGSHELFAKHARIDVRAATRRIRHQKCNLSRRIILRPRNAGRHRESRRRQNHLPKPLFHLSLRPCST